MDDFSNPHTDILESPNTKFGHIEDLEQPISMLRNSLLQKSKWMGLQKSTYAKKE